jgi:hypothetical protein
VPEREERIVDFEERQPASNANAPAVRVIQKRPRRVHAQGDGPRVDFDEIQPQHNENASPFGHTLTLPHRPPRNNDAGAVGGGEADTFNARNNRSGPRGRPNKGPRGNRGGPQQPRAPREVDGNVAPREAEGGTRSVLPDDE